MGNEDVKQQNIRFRGNDVIRDSVISAGLWRTGTIAPESTLKASLIPRHHNTTRVNGVSLSHFILRFFLLRAEGFRGGDESVSLKAVLSLSQDEESGRL